MKFKTAISLSLILSLMLFSCERETVITDIEYTPKIVANSLFSQEFPMEIRVSKSESVLAQTDEFELKNARVQVLSGGNSFDLEYDTVRNSFISKNLPQEGQEFLLIVNAEGFGTAQARSKIPTRPNNLEGILIESVSVDSFGVPNDQIRISFNDKPGEENFYLLQLYYFTNRFNSFLPFVPENALRENVGLTENREGAFLFTDKDRDGKQIELRFTVPFDQATKRDTIPRYYYELSSISKEYYEYDRTLKLYDEQPFNFGGLFFEPVQIYSNVINGRGVFGGKLVVRDSIP